MKVTLFDHYSKVNEPKYFDFDSIVEGIRHASQSTKSKIDEVRNSSDEKQRKKAKDSLPCICFSGKFTKRSDDALVEHSGLAVIDFDKLKDVQEVKDKLKLVPYIALAFVSPSGNGIKAVARIPKSIDHHRKNYDHLIDDLKGQLNLGEKHFDKTSQNPSRICYASYDPDLYHNPQAKTYIPPKEFRIVETDYNKINVAINMIRLSTDGQKHHTLLKAAKLMGGYIAGGVVEEQMAVTVLEAEIRHRDITDFKQAQRTIQDGLEYGKSAPLYEIEGIEGEANLDQMKVRLKSATRRYEFLSDPEDDDAGLERYIDGSFQRGLQTGYKELDEHFLFKEGEFNALIGHANTGKSWWVWWMTVVASYHYGWRWIYYCTENKTRQIKKKLIEFYCDQKIQDIEPASYVEAKAWVEEMFSFIRIDKDYSAYDLLDFAKVLMDEKEYKGFMIDPYNSLSADKMRMKEVGGNRHEYDYSVSTEFVKFCDKYNISIWLCAHPMTEALRRKHGNGHNYAGHPMPPEASDMEGGGKWINRVTGFFVVIHRYIYHDTDWRYTRVEIKKVKDVETGGKTTKYDEPIEFQLNKDMTHFHIRHNEFNPIHPNYNLPDGIRNDIQ